MEDNNIQFVVDENGYKHYLEKEIGRGGQGITWQTKDPNIIVKMKVNPNTGEPVVDEIEYEKFKNELDEVRILNLPDDIHIARPVSLLQKPYCGYTMRLLKDMQSIKYWIRPFDGTVSPGLFFYKTGGMRHRYQLLMNTAEIFAKLYAHSAVYADLSPENVFASGSLESSEVWLIDADNMRYKFDVKKQIQTPGYGAPEIIKGEMNSIQADEYSYAILAHEVLTMNSPFNGQLLIEGDGGGWDDEEVDYADLASKGEVAWIYDENDDSNRCKTGIGPKYALLIIANIITRFFVNLFLWLIIDRFSPNYLPLALIFEQVCYFIIEQIYQDEKIVWETYLRIALYIISLIGVMIHNEVVVINICNLGSDTKYFLDKKVQSEELYSSSDNPDILQKYETFEMDIKSEDSNSINTG